MAEEAAEEVRRVEERWLRLLKTLLEALFFRMR